MELYRVKYAKGRSAASWGEWQYYEGDWGKEKMLSDLLRASLEIDDANHRARFKSQLAKVLLGRQSENEPKYRAIYAVEQAVNNEWIPKTFHYRPPEVWLDD